jgi:Protein of unknown function (DUF3108)
MSVPRRWIALLAVSILLHLIVVELASGVIGLPAFRDRGQTAIVAQLHAAASRPVPAPAAAAASPPVRQNQPRPKLRRKAAPAIAQPAAQPDVSVQAIAENASAAATTPGPAPQPADDPVPAALPAPPAQSAAEAAAVPALEAQAPAEKKIYNVDVPPSAELNYDVQALREGQTVYGHGKIAWKSNGSDYTVEGEAGILLFTVLSFRSSGMLDDFGVAPVLYAEKRFRKPETNTHFQRERNIISFSASTASYPRHGGEQDRASIVWQLTGIGRGSGSKFAPGEEINFFVAGVRDAETWTIRIIGLEEIETGIGKTMAWHMVRVPRPGSYEQKLDIWLAPQQEWYPVRLRYTETSGDYLDMSLSGLTISKLTAAASR